MRNLLNIVGAVAISLVSFSDCDFAEKYEIEPVAKADFDGDGIDDVVGYTQDPGYSNGIKNFDLVFVKGKYIEKKNDLLSNFRLYASKEKIQMIQPNVRSFNEDYVKNVSVEDINDDGLPDISYDMIKTKRHRVHLNQGDGIFKEEF